MSASVVTHMHHGHAVNVAQHSSSAFPTAPLLNENRLEPIWPHYKYLPALLTIFQIELSLEASVHD